MNHVVEVVTFKLNSDIEEAAFLEAAEATFELLKGYDGYIKRELTVSEDQQWVDIVHWRDMQTALKAANDIMQSDIGTKFGGMIDPNSMQMYHVAPKIQG